MADETLLEKVVRVIKAGLSTFGITIKEDSFLSSKAEGAEVTPLI